MPKDPKVDPNKSIKHKDVDYTFKQLVSLYLAQCKTSPINHQTYRKVVKKVLRKYERQSSRRPTDADNDADEDEQADTEATGEESKQRRDHQLWVEHERLAQLEWRAKKAREDRLALHQARKHQQQQQKLHSHPQPRKQLNNVEITSTDDERPTHNPFMPSTSLTTRPQPQAQVDELPQICPYFLKTGVCKYGNMCTKAHMYDQNQHDFHEPMNTLIIPGMYKNMLLGYELIQLDNDCDDALEYEENDIAEHFKQFYDDVRAEMGKYGRLLQLLVCSNYQPHLRGNVYVQYEREEEAKCAFMHTNGRYYAGKMLTCYFTHVKNWHGAVCGAFLRAKCTKNYKCNYLHVFRNPYNEFRENSYYRLRTDCVNGKETEKKIEALASAAPWSSDEDLDHRTRNDKDRERKRRRSQGSERKPSSPTLASSARDQDALSRRHRNRSRCTHHDRYKLGSK